MSDIPTYTLNDGTTLPALGFGTYPLKGEEGIAAIVSALEAGYRLLDTAVNYENEGEVGEALRRSGLPRDQVQVASKLPGRHHGYDDALASVRGSLERIGLDYMDLHLIHWPNPGRGKYVEAWRALVQAQKDGLVRSIGVSNFTAEHLRTIIDDTGVTPSVNQIELHPRFPQEEMRRVHDELGIRTEAWSPMGKRRAPLDEDVVTAAAQEHGVSPGQVILRWHVQIGSLAIPKSGDPDRQRQNLDVFGFELTDEQVAAISGSPRPTAGSSAATRTPTRRCSSAVPSLSGPRRSAGPVAQQGVHLVRDLELRQLPSLRRPVTTPEESASSRFWLSLALASTFSMVSSIPTIARSCFSTYVVGASSTAHGCSRRDSLRPVSRVTASSTHAGSWCRRTRPVKWTAE